MQREFLLLLAISAIAKALPQNEVNNGSNDGTVEIVNKYAPRFKRPCKMYNMEMKPVGSSMRLRCVAEGNPMPNITWFKNNGPVERSQTFSLKPIFGKWSLALDELTRTDNGDYTCLVCNELGCISHTINIVVQEHLLLKPVITKGPGNQTIAVGATATFSCEFLTDLHPFVTWQFFRTSEELQNRNSTNEYHGVLMTSDSPDDKLETLTIVNVTQEDMGWYQCNAMNTMGASSGEGYLTVL